MSGVIAVLSILVYIVVKFVLPQFSGDIDKNYSSFNYKKCLVERVVDGDTIVVKLDNKRVKVRFSGVNTPESVGDYKNKPQYYGKEASKYTKKMLSNKEIYIELDKKKYDRYKRMLAYIWFEKPNKKLNGFFNAKLISEGYAKWYNDANNKKYAKLFKRLEKDARNSKKGLWRKR